VSLRNLFGKKSSERKQAQKDINDKLDSSLTRALEVHERFKKLLAKLEAPNPKLKVVK
jgi:hypothetical protein